MARRSPLEFDISVSADKARRARARGKPRGMTGKVETADGCCEWPGCTQPGVYRAPRDPDNLDQFRWFCLEHVREYNASWNYFDGWSQSDLDRQIEADRVWDKPTWGFGERRPGQPGGPAHRDGDAWSRWGFRDAHDLLGENATLNPGSEAAGANEDSRPRRRLPREEQQAMDTLGLSHEVDSRREVRARYTELVKELHPDMNGGANPEPERLARVIKAWRILRKSRRFRDDEAA